MKVLIASDVRVVEQSGKYYVKSQLYSIFKRYYEVFGTLKMYCRIAKEDSNIADYQDITAWIDQVIPEASLSRVFLGADNEKLKSAMTDCDLAICRCPSLAAYRAADCAKKMGKPYFAESMGCAWDAYWNHGIVGKVIAPYMFFKMKSVVKNANYALYVTNEFLQKRYPCKNESVGVSNVLIKNIDETVLQKRLEKIAQGDCRNVTLMTTAAVDVRYKGQEYVIKAIPELNKAGIRVRYLLVGGGDAAYLQGVAKACGVEDQVEFVGRKSLDEVFGLLDETDIYIQPSLQEGLPRSVIEAMSRACPVIGARTAGIPELIPEECVVRRKSAKDIAETVTAICNEEKLAQLAKRNFEESKNYLDEVLAERRNAYFKKIKQERTQSEER